MYNYENRKKCYIYWRYAVPHNKQKYSNFDKTGQLCSKTCITAFSLIFEITNISECRQIEPLFVTRKKMIVNFRCPATEFHSKKQTKKIFSVTPKFAQPVQPSFSTNTLFQY